MTDSAKLPADLEATFPTTLPDNWPAVLESRASATYLGDSKGTVDLLRATAVYLRQQALSQPITTEVREVRGAENAVMELFVDAMAEAEKAMRKFPQPNYVISKVAEEAGEVVKAAIHCAEGRDTPEHVAEEIRQAMAMLIRLYIEGDEVHGLPSIYFTLPAATTNDEAFNSPLSSALTRKEAP